MSISTQPNEMLDMILNQTGIPLAQRIRLRAVSHRFRATLEDGLLHENSLAIRIGDFHDLKNIKRGHLEVQPNDLIVKVANFTMKKAIDLIQRLFPRLTELYINSNSNIAWRKAPQLLRHFARTLLSLKVDGHCKGNFIDKTIYRNLGEAINSIVSLSSLYLENKLLEGSQYYYQPRIGHYLLYYLAPTLSRLERFTLEKPVKRKKTKFIAKSLSSRCTHLCLELAYNNGTTFQFHDSINLTHLNLEYGKDNVLPFVRQLPQLTTLILYDLRRPDLDTLLEKIRPLSQVTQVTFKGICYRRPLEPPASKAFTFPSIKQLTLQLKDIYNDSFNWMHYLQTLASWCPNLSDCALHCPEDYIEEILSIQEDLPYSIKLLDNFETTFE